MKSATHPAAAATTTHPTTEPIPAELDPDQINAAVQLPSALEFPKTEPWPEPVDGKGLLDELEQVVKRFVVVPDWASPTLALWILHTYGFQLREVSTYLGIESPEKRCGKTTLLTVLLELVHRPIVAANISSSALFRVIAETRPTLLIDEADTLLQGNDELRGILNSGYARKTAYIVRMSQQALPAALSLAQPAATNPQPSQPSSGAGTKLARYSCWCPKVMAAIGRLPETLADRCIVIRMQRKIAGEPCERLRNLEAIPFRRRCARFVRDHAESIASARPQLPPGLNDRAGDIWEPLLVLADQAGGDWPQKARRAALHFSSRPHQSGPTASLLLDILQILTRIQDDRIFSRLLVQSLNELADRPWTELTKGKPVTEYWLGHRLRHYGIASKTIRLGADVARGYAREDFTDAFRRYIPRADFNALVAELDQPDPSAPEPAGSGAKIQ